MVGSADMDPETITFGGALAGTLLAIGAWGYRSLDSRQSRTDKIAGDAMPRATADDLNTRIWAYMDVRRGEVDRRLTAFDQTMLTKSDLRDALVSQTAAMIASEARIMAAIQQQTHRRRTDAAE